METSAEAARAFNLLSLARIGTVRPHAGSALVALSVAIIGCAPPSGPARSAPPTAAAHHGRAPAGSDADIISLLDRVRGRLHVPGIAVAVVRDGEVRTYVRGHADLAWSTPVARDTSFQIASTTKILTGTLLLSLVADRALDLEAPVARYLPDAPASWRAVTLAQLAAHASGIPEVAVPAAASVNDVYAAARARPLAFEPGTAVAYMATDLSLLQLVMERVTKRTFAELLRDRVFAPAGMQCTRFEDVADTNGVRTADVIPRRAIVYRWTGDRQRSYWFPYPPHTYASGGAFACLDDLVRWAVALDRGLLPSIMDREAHRPFRLRDGSAASFGPVFSVGSMHGHPTYGHSGGPALADVVRVPDKRLTVIVLTNQQRLFPNLAATIASLELGAPPASPGIADLDLAMTREHRRVIEAIGAGSLTSAGFAPSAHAQVLPALREWAALQVGALPALAGLVLISDARSTAGRVRRYHAAYGPRIRLRWDFTLDAADRVVDVEGRLE